MFKTRHICRPPCPASQVLIRGPRLAEPGRSDQHLHVTVLLLLNPRVELYPPIEPHDRGMLDVGDGNFVSWKVSGAPYGKPAVILHGGPGQGCAPNMGRAFDPRRYRIVLFDQRGCGGSRPHASAPATEMRFNTTEHLVRDIEALRVHLGVDRWLSPAQSTRRGHWPAHGLAVSSSSWKMPDTCVAIPNAQRCSARSTSSRVGEHGS
jgi:hypothetical protein